MKHAFSIIPVLFLALLGATPCQAQEEANISVDPVRVVAGMPFYLEVTVPGGQISDVRLPQVDGIEFFPNSVRTSSQFNIINGRMTASVTRGVQAIAAEPGTYRIPSFEVMVEGQWMRTEPYTLDVEQASIQSSPPRNPNRRQSRNGDAQNNGISVDQAVFIEVEVDKEEVYKGEGILLTMSFWRHRGVEAGQRHGVEPEPPETEGFYTVKLEPRETTGERAIHGETHRYQIHQTRLMLFPVRSGRLVIPPWTMDAVVRVPNRSSPFGGAFSIFNQHVRTTLSSEAKTINVKPLPDTPKDFSGAIGDFELESSVSSKEVRVGEPLKLHYRIIGSGNPDAIPQPKPPQIAGVHVSIPEVVTKHDVDGERFTARKTYQYTVTPSQPGELDIPAIGYVYFNPEAGRYSTLRSQPFTVRVRPASSNPVRIVAGGDHDFSGVEVLTEDIEPIVTGPGNLEPGPAFPWFLATAYTLPVVGYIAFALYLHRKRFYASNTAVARFRFAKGKTLSRLDHVEQSREPAEALSRAITGYLADKFNVEEAGMTSQDIDRLFREHQVDPTAAEGFVRILEVCERVRYASRQFSTGEIRALIDGAKSRVEQLEAQLGKGAAV